MTTTFQTTSTINNMQISDKDFKDSFKPFEEPHMGQYDTRTSECDH